MKETSIFKNHYLIKLLVKRDISKMYRRSFLGYLWSVLNPLGVMLVMVFVFENLFKITTEHYAAYLISAQLLFEFVSSSTQQALFSVVGNASLLKKTNVPKMIFVFSVITSRLVNTLFSLIALIGVMLVTNVPITPTILLFPIVIVQVYFFALGIGLMLAQLAVFFRDLQYMYTVFITAWSYASAIFYPVETLSGVAALVITKLNPMYYYIYQFRCLTVYSKFPEPFYLIGGIVAAALSMLFGILLFNKSKSKFFLYI